MSIPPESSDQRFSLVLESRVSFAPMYAPTERNAVWNNAANNGRKSTDMPETAALSPMAKESMERINPSRMVSAGSNTEDSFLSQREGA